MTPTSGAATSTPNTLTTAPPPSSSSPTHQPHDELPWPSASSPRPNSCSASITNNAWGSGFVTTVRVTAGPIAIDRWTVTIAMPSGSDVVSTWSAEAIAARGNVPFNSVFYNGRLAAGGTTEFGFLGINAAPTGTPFCAAF